MYWQHIPNPYDLVNEKLDNNHGTAQTLIKLPENLENRGYHVAMFRFSNDKKMIDGQSLTTSYNICEQGIIFKIKLICGKVYYILDLFKTLHGMHCALYTLIANRQAPDLFGLLHPVVIK